ncbi:MAG: site-specific DNA-methyltransferase, partial [Candidatus Levybacteria bacterium]|nr:site-specific DNA-methyltransferase [Candidatus Levybacteria bacterium]
MKIFTDIEKVLKKDSRLWSKDEKEKLLKNKLVELVSNDDEKLLELLLSDKETKNHFIKKIKDSTIFLKDKFLQFITMNEFLPDSFTAFENEIGLSDDRKLITQRDEISLVFPHKDCLLEGGQTKEEIGREEIFYNTILAPDEIDRIKEPKVLVNWNKFDKDGKHEVKEISKQDNLIIKGNNLLALYSLLPKYSGEIKLIYIDPPYNTGNDEFGYNDKFNHSAWLTFMKNRLEVAQELLREDGTIFIQCDHHELGYLNVLMDNIFEEKNKIQIISVKTSSPAGFKTVNPGPIDTTEYILYYAKDKKKVLFKKG